MRRDYYAVLGIASTAPPREIRQAYRRLARQYSPDVNFWDEHAQGLFEEIAEAYRVLGDPAARAIYDRFGPPGPGALGPGRRGEDVHISVDLTFGDAARGVALRLEVPRFSPCAGCSATGTDGETPCRPCHGRGVRRAIDLVEVAIPAGVDTGTQFRVRHEGHAGPFGGPRGDLVVSTRVQEHPFFKREGEGVGCEVPISVWEALRGARVQVPTLTGEAVLVVPPGTPGGQVFRLRGQGLPRLSGDGVGDLYVRIRLEVPAGLDARTDDLVRELERLVPLAPRAGLDRYAGGAQ
ncbi:MAG TPA: J domain-containing protein [Methylomirabilota bacterium]|nr:J domain-containing protein [Methylomirabilota bacterium]